MLNQRLSPSITLRVSPLQLVAACGIGLLLGAACVWLSPLWVLGALGAGALMLAVIRRPEIGLLGILIATSSIVFEDRLPLVPIGVGSLHIPDLILLALLGLIVLRWLVEGDFNIVHTPLDWPLLSFYGVALLSTLIAVFGSSVGFNRGMAGMRVVSYYLTFFVVTNLVQEEHQLIALWKGITLLASIVAVVMIAQFLAGGALQLVPGYVGTLSDYRGITRIVVPGRSLVLLSFIATTVTLVLNRSRMINILILLQWGLLGSAVALTFLRSDWVAIGLALFLLAYLVREHDRRRLLGLGLVVMLAAVLVLVLASYRPDSQVVELLKAFSDRLSTLASSGTLSESSLQWRYVENEHALRQIASHPLLGLGLGARYRPWDPRIDYAGINWDAWTFIHNGHLWVLLGTGVLGYLCLTWLSVTFLIRGFRSWRFISDGQIRAIVLSSILFYLGLVIMAAVNCIFGGWSWTPVIGIIMGANEVAFRGSIQRER